MTSNQRLLFVNLLREANSKKSSLSVKEVANKLGISPEEARRPWHTEIRYSFAIEFDSKWMLYANEK